MPPEYILTSEFRDLEKTRECTRKLLALENRPTCILFPDDTSAMGGLRAIHDAGLKVPGDISVAGYDGVELATLQPVPMTTVVQDCNSIGRHVGEEILKAINRSDSFEPQHIIIPVTLFTGETIADIT